MEDYLPLHKWFDQTKAHISDMRHRALLHNTLGIELAQQVFGDYLVNSDGNRVAIKVLAEQHVLQDLKFIPTVNDCFGDMAFKDWMIGKHNPIRQMVLGKLDADDGARKVGVE